MVLEAIVLPLNYEPIRALRGCPAMQVGRLAASAGVGAAGLEPATSASRTLRAAKLRHAPEPSVGAEPTASSLPRTRSTAELTRLTTASGT